MQPEVQQIMPVRHLCHTPLHHPPMFAILLSTASPTNSCIIAAWANIHQLLIPADPGQKQIRPKRRRKINPCTVIHHQPIHQFRMVKRQFHRNPSTHRPPAHIGLRQVHRLHELHHNVFFHRDRIVHIRLLRSPIPQQVRRIHMKTLRRQRRIILAQSSPRAPSPCTSSNGIPPPLSGFASK